MIPTRRHFFGSVPLSWTLFAQALRAAPSPVEERYWQLVRQQFPLSPGLVYLNAANVCPSSRPVLDRHQEFLRDFHANPSFQNREKYAPLQEKLREQLAALLRVTADEIAITRNTSESTNTVVKGLDLKAGDEVVVTSHNHPSNLDSWAVRAKREGLAVKRVAVPVPALNKDELLRSIEQAVTPRTRVISVTHVTNTTGVRYPAKEIAELARQRRCWMHLDGAQTFGALDVNLREIGCDSYSGSAHKWMMGPLEAGVLYVRAERVAELWPSIVTAGWSDQLRGARKFDVFGQRDDPRVVAFLAAVEFLQMIGTAQGEQRVRQLTGKLKQAWADAPGLQLLTSPDPLLSGGVVKVRFTRQDQKAVYDELYRRHRFALSVTPAGEAAGIRFSPHLYNTMEEIDQVARTVRTVAAG